MESCNHKFYKMLDTITRDGPLVWALNDRPMSCFKFPIYNCFGPMMKDFGINFNQDKLLPFNPIPNIHPVSRILVSGSTTITILLVLLLRKKQITQTIVTLPVNDKKIQWVKGHQDDVPDDLSIAAQYNIQADTLAESAYPTRTFQSNDIIILPAAKCNLLIDGLMIQSNYPTAIRNMCTIPPYKQYITNRHQWMEAQASSIDWQLLERAIAKSNKNHVQMTKFLHNKLPTNAELAKSNPHQSKQCPYCDQVGTFHHLLCCSNPLSDTF